MYIYKINKFGSFSVRNVGMPPCFSTSKPHISLHHYHSFVTLRNQIGSGFDVGALYIDTPLLRNVKIFKLLGRKQ